MFWRPRAPLSLLSEDERTERLREAGTHALLAMHGFIGSMDRLTRIADEAFTSMAEFSAVLRDSLNASLDALSREERERYDELVGLGVPAFDALAALSDDARLIELLSELDDE